jgi:hypothetical protein
MRLKPFIGPKPGTSVGRRVRCLFVVGAMTAPDSRFASWLMLHRYLHGRSLAEDGSTQEHWRFRALSFEVEAGKRLRRLEIRRRIRRRPARA